MFCLSTHVSVRSLLNTVFFWRSSDKKIPAINYGCNQFICDISHTFLVQKFYFFKRASILCVTSDWSETISRWWNRKLWKKYHVLVFSTVIVVLLEECSTSLNHVVLQRDIYCKSAKWWKTESKTKTFASFGSHCRLQGRLFAHEGSARSYVREERTTNSWRLYLQNQLIKPFSSLKDSLTNFLNDPSFPSVHHGELLSAFCNCSMCN